jgi:hypothetical protein
MMLSRSPSKFDFTASHSGNREGRIFKELECHYHGGSRVYQLALDSEVIPLAGIKSWFENIIESFASAPTKLPTADHHPMVLSSSIDSNYLRSVRELLEGHPL